MPDVENGTMGVEKYRKWEMWLELYANMGSVTFKTLCYPPQTRINVDIKFKIPYMYMPPNGIGNK